MEADIDLVSRLDELVRETRTAARAEDDPRFAEGTVDIFVPPALVTELNRIAAGRIELADDRIQPGFGIAEARRQLEKKAAHPLAENIRDDAEIPDQRFCTFEFFDVCDELADLDCVDDILAARLTAPRLNIRDGRP